MELLWKKIALMLTTAFTTGFMFLIQTLVLTKETYSVTVPSVNFANSTMSNETNVLKKSHKNDKNGDIRWVDPQYKKILNIVKTKPGRANAIHPFKFPPK